ncbi:MAG: hypothetical protein IPO60_12360 [Flavobacteriales bacterium]|nr:hypothetical protein [Flavobacteriales bacterium]
MVVLGFGAGYGLIMADVACVVVRSALGFARRILNASRGMGVSTYKAAPSARILKYLILGISEGADHGARRSGFFKHSSG